MNIHYLWESPNKELPVIFMDNIASVSHGSAFSLFGCKNKVRHSQYQSYAKLWPKCGQHKSLKEAILFWGSLHWHLEGQPLNSFFLKVTYFVSQHRKWPSRTFVDFVLEKMELARVVDWFAWLEISWRIWRKEKSCQLPQLWFQDSVHSSFLPSQRLEIVASPLILHRRRQIFIAFYFQIFNYPRKHFSLQMLFFALFVYIARWSGSGIPSGKPCLDAKSKEIIHVCFLLAFPRLAAEFVDKICRIMSSEAIQDQNKRIN